MDRAGRWVVTGLGAVLVAALVYVFGPLTPQLQAPAPLAVFTALPVLLWAAANAALDISRRARGAALVAGAASGDATARREEEDAIAARLARALRAARGAGQRDLVERPWYVLIGPPGAGKTTALLNAELRFPLGGETGGEGPVAGVGGTRLCDWWLTEDAVMIDTAGRYTTQDSDAAVDEAGWKRFLRLLRQTRKRRGLNGVFVMIGLPEIASGSADTLRRHARAVRARTRELEEELGLRLPVYAVLTKADLLAGFTEFFDDLDRAGRRQPWGVTFEPGRNDTLAGFRAAFTGLLADLRARSLDRLQAERSAERRALIASFPGQLATLARPLAAFLDDAFGLSGDRAAFLRGVFLVSGTQAGTPIDRLTGAMARDWGLDATQLPSLRPERGRSYFLTELLRELVLGEAALVSDSPRAARRSRHLRRAAFATLAVLVLGGVGGVLAASLASARQVAAVDAQLARYEGVARGTRLDPIADADLVALLPLLEAAQRFAADVPAASGDLPLGLSPREKLRAAAAALYRHALDDALLPRLVWRLETQIRGHLAEPGFTYQATRIYLMLGGMGPLDRELVRSWMRLDWSRAFAQDLDGSQAARLGTQLDALLAAPLPPVPLDGALIADARASFGRVSLAERVYSRVRPAEAAATLPPWRPADALGPLGSALFVRASGRPLADGVPGFLTPDGFRRALLPGLPAAVRAVAAESWVLGHADADALDPASLPGLERAVVRLYEADYEAAWDGLLRDLAVTPLRTPAVAAENLFILASSASPIRTLLRAAVPELTLAGTDAATGDLRVSALLGVTGAEAATAPLGADVDAHYRDLREAVLRDDGAALDAVLRPLAELERGFASVAAHPAAGWPVTGTDPVQTLHTAADTAPAPLQHWLLALADQAAALRQGDPRTQVMAAYDASGGPATLCPLVANGRFPFEPASALDAPLDDWTRLFAPGGLFDGFLNIELAPYVDRTAHPWRPQPANGVAPPFGADAIARFGDAAAIRDAFFAGGGGVPHLRFTITPASLDAGARSATLSVGAASITATHEAGHATEFSWPGPPGGGSAALVFDPAPAGGTGVLEASGPWALFRLASLGTMAAGRAGERILSFRLGDRAASFAITGGAMGGSTTGGSTAADPFATALLQRFRCPAVQ